MSGTKLRVGIAGAGWVAGARHLPSLLSHPDVEVVAIYDPKIERAAALATSDKRRSSAPIQSHDDLARFLALDLDIVHVTSSPWSHASLAHAAFESGAHVFTEKPMAMNLAEATAMADAARDADRMLCVSHNFLWSHAMIRAKKRLAGAPVDYVMGMQLSADSRRLPEWFRDLPGGLMFDEAPHMLYTLGDLLGGELRLDHTRGTFDDDGHPRTVEVLVSGRTGSGQVTMVFCAPVSEWHVMASSRARVVALDLFRDIEIDVGPDGEHGSLDIARSSLAAVGGHVAGFATAGARWARGRQFWGHDTLIHAFCDAVRDGLPVPVSVDDALGVVALTDDLLSDLGVAGRP